MATEAVPAQAAPGARAPRDLAEVGGAATPITLSGKPSAVVTVVAALLARETRSSGLYETATVLPAR